MKIIIHPSESTLPCDRGYAISMTIKSFKGRKNVEILLFRCEWSAEELKAYNWDMLLGEPIAGAPGDKESSKRVLLETFTEEEREQIISFLAEQYKSRLNTIEAHPLTFPIPSNLPALFDAKENKNIGFIRFQKIPSYNLDIPLAGFYDLSRHEPLAEDHPSS